jgi:hypothetical protein
MRNEEMKNKNRFTSVAEPKICLSAPTPRSRKSESAPAPESFIRYPKNYFFDLSNIMNIVTIYGAAWLSMVRRGSVYGAAWLSW